MTVRLRLTLIASLGFALAGCNGIQSALSPQGAEAAQVATLFWIMTWTGAAILLGVMILTGIAIFGRERWRSPLRGEWIVVGGGIVFPSVLLSTLLVAGFLITGAESSSRAGQASVRIAVVGEQWWWRVVYRTPDGRRVESANEIRIPAGERVAFELSAADVIHSLWVPTLAGKLDMIPGRKTVLNVIAREPGVSRGQCAEYCGGAHALMSLYVVALERPQFDDWLMREASAARPPEKPEAIDGQKLFFAGGCAACHTIRGTEAAGTLGPDLTHLGSRMSLAAAVLPNDATAIARWIRDNQHIKPDNKMPPYGMFSDAELKSLASYLAGLK